MKVRSTVVAAETYTNATQNAYESEQERMRNATVASNALISSAESSLHETRQRKWMGRDSNSRPPVCKTPEIVSYNRQAFITYLQNIKNQELDTAKDNASFIGTFVKSGKSAIDFVTSYSKPNSYNNALNALKHYCDFLGVPRPALKQKRRSPDALIIPPKLEEIQRVIRNIREQDVKTYVALCSSVGLRPQRLLKAGWSEIDFVNGFVNINERHGKKVYRPNPLHKDVAMLLQELKKTSGSDRIFTFAYKKVANALKAVNTTIRPNNCRDFFYNHARRSGVDKDLVDWLAGHSIGIRAHYLADTIKEEYAKFETSFRIAV